MAEDFVLQEFLLKNSMWIALALGSGLMLLVPALTGAGARRVTVAQATLMLNQKKAVLVDIREDDLAAKTGYLSGAKRMLANEIADKLPTQLKDKSTPVIVVCQVGQRSNGAAKAVKGLGYEEVYTLDGGVNAWVEAGMPLKKSAAEAPQSSAKGKGKGKGKTKEALESQESKPAQTQKEPEQSDQTTENVKADQA